MYIVTLFWLGSGVLFTLGFIGALVTGGRYEWPYALMLRVAGVVLATLMAAALAVAFTALL